MVLVNASAPTAKHVALEIREEAQHRLVARPVAAVERIGRHPCRAFHQDGHPIYFEQELPGLLVSVRINSSLRIPIVSSREASTLSPSSNWVVTLYRLASPYPLGHHSLGLATENSNLPEMNSNLCRCEKVEPSHSPCTFRWS